MRLFRNSSPFAPFILSVTLPPVKSMSTKALWFTAARGIQQYVMTGNKLREMIGASRLADQLANRYDDCLLGELLKKLGIEKDAYTMLTAAASQARYLFHDRADAERLAAWWPMAVAQHAPGLQVVQTIVDWNEDEKQSLMEAIRKAEIQLIHERNCVPASMPQANPLTARAQRTGQPAVSFSKDKEAIDAAQEAKQLASRNAMATLKTLLPDGFKLDESLYNKFPLDFEQIATEGSYLAVIHADGNGLGQLLMGLNAKGGELEKDNEKAKKFYPAFSKAIDSATREAVKTAIAPLLEKWKHLNKYPFRPILCAGDDLTLVIRASDALEFSKSFLQNFEDQSTRKLEALKKESGVSFKETKLTAGLGIAYVKGSFPYHLAYKLCESLTQHAKKESKREYSAIAFHRVSSSSTREFDEVLKRELTVSNGGLLLCRQPYAALEGEPRPISVLQDVVTEMRQLPRGAMREVLTEAWNGQEPADRRLERIAKVCKSKTPSAWKEFEKVWRTLHDIPADAVISVFTNGYTSLHDAISLCSPGILEKKGTSDSEPSDEGSISATNQAQS